MFGFGAPVEPYSGASGDLLQDRQEASEFGAHRDIDAVDECRDEVVGVFQRVADEGSVFLEDARGTGETVLHAVEFSVDGLRAVTLSRGRRFFADKFIIHGFGSDGF